MLNLMIVEDHKWTRDGLAKTIPWGEMDIQLKYVCEDGRQACDILKEHSIDIIITDIKMNEIDGIELTRFAKGKYPGVEVIIISAHQDFEYAHNALNLGAFAYIIKPIDRDEIIDKVKKAAVRIKKERGIQKSEPVVNRQSSRQSIIGAFHDYLLQYTEDSVRLSDELKNSGIAVASTKYLVFVLKSLDKNSRNNILREQINSLDILIYTFIHSDFLVGLYLLTDEMAIYSFRKTISRIKEIVKSENLRICTGNTADNLNQLGASYEKALSVLNHCYLYGKKDIVYYNDVCDLIKQKGKMPVFDYEFIFNSMEVLKTAELDNYFDKAVDAFRSCNANQSNILTQCTALIEKAGKGIEKYGLSMQEFILKAGGSEALCSGEKLTDVIEYLKNLFGSISKELWQRRGMKVRGIVSIALDCIHDNYGMKELNLNWVSNKIGVNYSYLSKCFKEDVGMSFTDYVNRYRISMSKRHLKNTGLKLYEICSMVGIDYRYFNTLFKEYENMSPMEYKKL